MASDLLLPPAVPTDKYPPKKRKVERACDVCRRKKSRCDGWKMPNNVCSNCIQSRKPCTYVEESKPRGPPKAYVTDLEDRVEKLEALLKKLRPDQDFSNELGPPVVRGSWKDPPNTSSVPSASGSLEPSSSSPSPGYSHRSSHLLISPTTSKNRDHSHARRHSRDNSLSGRSSDSPYSSDPDDLVDGYEGGMHQLTLRKASHLHSEESKEEQHERFHGQSSSMKLIDATRRFKQQHFIESVGGAGGGDSNASIPYSSSGPKEASLVRRPEYWQASRWELVWEGLHVDSPELLSSVLEAFPPQDLMAELIRLYFENANSQHPLLHRPTFEKQWRENLHEKNIWFACVMASLFAVASRWCNDPRVLPKDYPKENSGAIDWTLAGWDFFNIGLGIHRARRSLLYPATLFEIQTFTLLSMFLRGTSYHTVGWFFVTIGIRKAQDVGAHRKTVYKRTPTVDEELWKRAFWMLVVFDRFICSLLGRSCCIAEEDFDLELPLEVDDEYWETEDPSAAFKQPEGVPCKITAFNLWIKLTQIIAFALRTLYPLNTSKLVYGRIPMPGPKAIVQQLETTLSEWADSIPEYLKWSNQIKDPIFVNQSAALYTNYYLTQILVYRQFLQPSFAAANAQPSPFPALVLCSNAAKSCARIIETQMERKSSDLPNLINVSNICAAILIVHLWDLKGKEKAQIVNLAEDIKPHFARPIQALKDDIALFIRALECAALRHGVVLKLLAQLRQSLDDEASAQNIAFDNDPPSWVPHPIPNPSSRWDDTARNNRLRPVQTVSQHYDHDPSRLQQTNWPLPQPPTNDHHDATLSDTQHPPPFISAMHRTPSASNTSYSPTASQYDSGAMDFPGRYHWEERGVGQHLPTSHARSTPTMAIYDKPYSGTWDELHRNMPYPPSGWSEGYTSHLTHRPYSTEADTYR
ncbi:hypothetical protein K435DRAFT_966309 [Dendrothele bispora CBS 962.96]|uniref:Zn(2)-C6 fungal-type domain-containing protein n=1 Tax=Dendrothele bispora (strain CBS 962.96) TaxID=1314807 RepID=A0A4S8M1X6_DENBC|nr:hypothetical protein K435DRAFT_966309 [Dendrothele bispora CBS 962.96]